MGEGGMGRRGKAPVRQPPVESRVNPLRDLLGGVQAGVSGLQYQFGTGVHTLTGVDLSPEAVQQASVIEQAAGTAGKAGGKAAGGLFSGIPKEALLLGALAAGVVLIMVIAK